MSPGLPAVVRALALLAALALGGCASMGPEQCKAARWEKLGRADGARGETPDRFESYRKDCAEHGIEPPAEVWRRGYETGLNEFCTPAGAYPAARAGHGEAELCAGRHGEEEFHTAFKHGRQVNLMLREVREMYARLRDGVAAVMSGEYSRDQITVFRARANPDLVDSLRRRQVLLEQHDRVFCEKYGVAPLAQEDFEQPPY
ncbi:MAG: DUF2799 domain-containing protein [Gammaproteobacteria bacterium]